MFQEELAAATPEALEELEVEPVIPFARTPSQPPPATAEMGPATTTTPTNNDDGKPYLRSGMDGIMMTKSILPSLPEDTAIRDLLPKFHHLTRYSPQRKSSVEPHTAIVEPVDQFRVPTVADVQDKKPRESSALSLKSVGEDPGETKEKELTSTAELVYSDRNERMDQHIVSILDNQAKELERYRNIVRKMGEDMNALRKQIAELDYKNSELKTKLYYAGDLNMTNVGKLVEDAAMLNNADPEAQIVYLKRKLLAETEENAEMTQRLHQLQNSIILKNEREEDHLRLEEAHNNQNEILQKLQNRVARMAAAEKTIKTQEQVIEELEKANEKFSSKKAKLETKFTKAVNKENQPKAIADNPVPVMDGSEMREKLRLIQKLEKAEGRVIALEEQLANNTRLWAREKTDMQMNLNRRVLSDVNRTFKPLSPPPIQQNYQPARNTTIRPYPYDQGGTTTRHPYATDAHRYPPHRSDRYGGDF